MYFSNNLIKSITKELADQTGFDTNALFNLIYHLKLPGDGVPSCVAEVIATDSVFIKEKCPFPGRLAYGVVDTTLLLRDLTERYREQAKVCKQVEKVGLSLLRLNQPAKIIYDFNKRLASMVFMVSAVNDLSDTDKKFTPLERSILLEKIIESALEENELTIRLIEHITKNLDRSSKNYLLNHVNITLDEGLKNDPWNDEITSLLPINAFPFARFRLSLTKHSEFNKHAIQITDCIRSYCRI